MSTRNSIYWEDGGIHIYQELIDPGCSLYLEYSNGPFLIKLPLSQDLSEIILRGLDRKEEIRAYFIPLAESFRHAAKSYPEVSIDPEIMAGAPCIQGTRIPVYMILDAIECQGSVQGALESYPRLTLDQVKEAIGFAKLVVECPTESGVPAKPSAQGALK